MARARLPVWQIPVTDTLDHLVEEAVAKDTHVTKSDLIREAVREKLSQMGFSYVNKSRERVPNSPSSASNRSKEAHQ